MKAIKNMTGKDLDYLSDMFNWNYNAFKNSMNSYEKVTDSQLSKLLENAISLFDSNMIDVIEVLGGKCE